MVNVTFKPTLDAELAIKTRSLRLPGNWQLTKDGSTWADFQIGKTDAVRSIRYKGRQHWVLAQRTEVSVAESMFTNVLAFGALGLLASSDKPGYYTTLQWYSTDPRHDHSGWDATLGGGTIKKTLQDRVEFQKQLDTLRTRG